MRYKIAAIVAMDKNRAIGNKNELPWNVPEDLKRFSKLTSGHTVLMGKNTFYSLPKKYRPLPNRLNVVFSTTMQAQDGILVQNSVEGFLNKVKNDEVEILGDTLWIIGGQKLYSSTINLWQEVELTLVKGEHQADTYFPEFESSFNLVKSIDSDNCKFLTYKRN